MFHLVLLDDNADHSNLLEVWLRQICEEVGLDARVALVTTDAQDVLDFACGNCTQTAYFLDIELGQSENGIDICKKIHTLDTHAYIVYVSAYQHHAFACLKSHAFDFLLKPFTKAELSECLIAMMRDGFPEPAVNPIAIQIGSRSVMIDPMSVTHFSIQRNTTTAHTDLGNYTWRGSLAALVPDLDQRIFARIHRSYIVNLQRIRDVDWVDDCLSTDSGAIMPIARRGRKRLHETLRPKAR